VTEATEASERQSVKASERAGALPEPRSDAPHAPTLRRILLAEDDPRIRAALEIRLTAAGYQVQVAVDGVSSYLAAMSDHPPDLILMDIFMARGSGLEVAQQLEALDLVIPIIFLTASRQPGLRERAAELHAAGFFEKPFDFDDILAAIAEKLG